MRTSELNSKPNARLSIPGGLVACLLSSGLILPGFYVRLSIKSFEYLQFAPSICVVRTRKSRSVFILILNLRLCFSTDLKVIIFL